MNDANSGNTEVRLTLGLDASTVSTGWSIVASPKVSPQKRERRRSRGQTELRASGVLSAPKTSQPVDRLLLMAAQLEAVIREHHPTEIAIESAFVFLNSRTALSLGEVRGALLLTAAQAGLPIFQYPPSLIKQQIAGHGNATKRDVAEAVRLMLGVDISEMLHDTTDAIACALCHIAESEQTAKGLPRSTFTKRRARRPSRPPKTNVVKRK
jgi:crossover junction endodeoxyribonuclease RuvC